MLLKMKTALKFFLISIVFQLFLVNSVFSLDLNTRDEYLLDTRGDDGDICRSYITLNKKIESPEIEISAFIDSQWNLETDAWEKVLLGVEVRKSLWKYLHVGQSLQFISGEMLDYMAFDIGARSYDTTTKIGVDIPFLKYFSFRAFEEYSINLEEFRDEYNEVGVEVVYTPKKLFSISLGWRHTDRIHNFDTDYASMSLSFHF